MGTGPEKGVHSSVLPLQYLLLARLLHKMVGVYNLIWQFFSWLMSVLFTSKFGLLNACGFPKEKVFWCSLAIPMVSFGALFPKAHKIFPKVHSLWEYQMLSSDEQQAACSWSLMSTSNFTSTETGGGHAGFTVVFGTSATALGEILVA